MIIHFRDYVDLSSQNKAVHEVAIPLDESKIRKKGRNYYLKNFANEIRKAYS